MNYFDDLLDYPRVQTFINSIDGRTAGAVANDITKAIRGAKHRGMEPDTALIWQEVSEKWGKYYSLPDKTEALYAIEYYTVWETLTPTEKEEIRRARLDNFIATGSR